MTETHSGSAVDLLVIGGGTAGIVAAKTAARFGADVLLVERDRMGGDCLWTGCVPSKSLIAAAPRSAPAYTAASAQPNPKASPAATESTFFGAGVSVTAA
ncbi:MAG: FAD-dependent oxidoreductase [Microcella pacifica]|uniref:FAD-dependent oxidoreductase n=1 Tax=Microcella pacifica TaxID=2591847 RepID=UPI0033159E41